ncbi:MAG: DUF523 domain-containing protein [Candidatus Diapherotrites archaeon]|nr:DUF523 domain-containing protein [Candidatus Diapherotrites archaeon]
MFTDERSKQIVLVSHCILNQNSISDGTADYPAAINEIVELLLKSNIGVIQMPCPELLCIGLDRGNIHGCEEPVVVENTRIRSSLNSPSSTQTIKTLVKQLVYQIEEYSQNGFTVLGLIGINRSPSCGVNTTSMNNREVDGEGVFIKALREELEKKDVHIKMVGIKASEMEKALVSIKKLVDNSPQK